MPKRVAPLNAMQVERIKPGQELIDGGVPGLRVTRTAAGLSWGLSIRVKGARRWIKVGIGSGLPRPAEGPNVFAKTSLTAGTRLKSMRRQSNARGTL
jgi:hypothetical protein